MVLASNEWLNNCNNVNILTIAAAINNTNTTLPTTTTPAIAAINYLTTTVSTMTTTTSETTDLLATTDVTPNAAAETITTTTTESITTTPTALTIAATTTENANDSCSEQQFSSELNKSLADNGTELQAQLVLILHEDEHKTYDNAALSATVLKTATATSNNNNNNNNSSNCSGSNNNINNNNNNNSLLNEFHGTKEPDDISNSSDNLDDSCKRATLTTTTTATELKNIITENNCATVVPYAAKLCATNNWCSDTLTAGTNGAQSTESYLTALGVDISGLNTNTLNLQQTANKLSSTYLCDEKISSGNCTVTSPSASALGIRSSSNVVSNSYLDMPTVDGASSNVAEQNGQAKIVLICEDNSHPFQSRTIMLTPNIECKVGRLMAKSRVSESNAIFDCKVLSRNHAVLWYTPDDQKFWVKDTKSSNGTFINDQKLGNDAAELHYGDIVKFGVDVVENSRKEVHGCIIASVKLYLPDGREAISIDCARSDRSAYSTEKCIKYDELHRLNLYVQEVSQREKNLKSKLFNIQNILDATRKNSGLCWQALIAEDQLLHRIHMLEKKLQVMEKNVPESTLRNEVIKLLEDKSSYQHTAKEALRKVYQERCEAMQLLAKMESAFAQSENECKVLRDQVMSGKQTLQEMTNRLHEFHTDYIEYKVEVQHMQQEAREREEARIEELKSKLSERELAYEALERKFANMQDVEPLEHQAIAKLDAAIADMDMGDDYDENDEDAGSANNADQLDHEENLGLKRRITAGAVHKETINGVDVVQLNNSKNERTMATKHATANAEKIKDTIVLKWLENSDLNKKEGSLDIINAICNDDDSDSSDEPDVETLPLHNSYSNNNTAKSLQIFYKHLLQLEANLNMEAQEHKDKFIENEKTEIKEIETLNGANEKFNEQDQSYGMLKKSVVLLREAYNDLLVAQALQSAHKDKSHMKLDIQQTIKEEPATDALDSASELEDDSQLITTRMSTEAQVKRYQEQIAELTNKLQCIERDSNSTMDMLIEENNNHKDKLLEMFEQLNTLRADKACLEARLTEHEEKLQKTSSADNVTVEEEIEMSAHNYTPYSSTATTPTHSTLMATSTRSVSFEAQMREEQEFSDMEREEELVRYKENWEQSQMQNLKLRKEIVALRQKINTSIILGVGPLSASVNRLRYILPYGAAAVLMLCMLYLYY